MASRREWLVAALALAVTGCSRDTPPFDPANPMAGLPVRTDPEPIRKRFADLGEFTELHWQGRLTGSGFPPGPSDTLIQALVVLDPGSFTAITEKYAFLPAGSGWDAAMTDALRPHAPDPGEWRHSEQFEADVCAPSFFHGRVQLEMRTGTVFLDVSTS